MWVADAAMLPGRAGLAAVAMTLTSKEHVHVSESLNCNGWSCIIKTIGATEAET